MANAIYPKTLEQMWQGGINAASGNVKAVLVDLADYTYSAAHQFLSDVPAGARVATSPNLANKTFTNGVFDADDTTFPGVTGDQAEAIITYIDTGTPTTSRLLTFADSGTGLPVTPNSGDIDLEWNANGIGRLGS
jgi:hypothetical protein